MKTKLFGTVTAVTVLLMPFSASASTLSGSVMFDKNTDLYTYSYSIENDTLSPIWELDVLVKSVPINTRIGPPKFPPNYTLPTGWTMQIAYSGAIAFPPYNEYGGFFDWYGGLFKIPPGSQLSGFSFSTPFAPTISTLNNYFLYGDAGVAKFGHIVAPNFPTPLPAALPAFGAGLGLMGLLIWRRKV